MRVFLTNAEIQSTQSGEPQQRTQGRQQLRSERPPSTTVIQDLDILALKTSSHKSTYSSYRPPKSPILEDASPSFETPHREDVHSNSPVNSLIPKANRSVTPCHNSRSKCYLEPSCSARTNNHSRTSSRRYNHLPSGKDSYIPKKVKHPLLIQEAEIIKMYNSTSIFHNMSHSSAEKTQGGGDSDSPTPAPASPLRCHTTIAHKGTQISEVNLTDLGHGPKSTRPSKCSFIKDSRIDTLRSHYLRKGYSHRSVQRYNNLHGPCS